jgi:hypothetical protein
MNLIVQFLNFVVGGLVQVYQNRAAYEKQKELINQQWEATFAQNAAAEEYAGEQIVMQFDAAMSEEVKKGNEKALKIAAVIIVVAIIIALLMKFTFKDKK